MKKWVLLFWFFIATLSSIARLGFANEDLRRGYESFLNKNYTNAVSALSLFQGFETHPLRDYYRFAFGRSKIETGETESGIEELQKLLEEEPESLFADDARIALVKAWILKKDFERAKKFLEKNLENFAEEDLGQAYEQLGQIALENKDKQAAVNAFKKAFFEFPDRDLDAGIANQLKTLEGQTIETFASADLLKREKALLKNKRYADALIVQSILLKRGGLIEISLLLRYGKTLVDLSRYSEAIVPLQKVLKSNGSGDAALDRQALLDLGTSFLKLNRTKDAVLVFEQLQKKYPDTEEAQEALYRLGMLELDAKDLEKASVWFLALSKQTKSGSFRDKGLWNIAWAYYEQSEWKKSAVFLEALEKRALDLPTQAKAIYWQARALQKQNQNDAAKSLFEKAADRAPLSYYGFMALKKMGGSEDVSEAPKIPEGWKQVLSGGFALNLRVHASNDAENTHFKKATALYEIGLGRLALREWQAGFEAISKDSSKLAALLNSLSRRPAFVPVWFAQRKWEHFRPLFEDEKTAEAYRNAIQFPFPYVKEIEASATEFNVPKALVVALMRQESAFQPWISSSANAQGLMQLLPSTADLRAKAIGTTVSNLFNPAENIRLGTAELAFLLNRFSNNWVDMISGYNAGPARPPKWRQQFSNLLEDEYIESIPFGETNLYVKLVLRNYWIYRALSEK